MDKMTQGPGGFAVCGSFCTLDAALVQAERLVQDGWQLIPVMSYAAAGQDTRFGTAAHWRARLEQIAGRPVLDTLQGAEPLGPKNQADCLVIALVQGPPSTRLAAGLSDTPVKPGRQKPAAGGKTGGDRPFNQRWAGRFRREYRPAGTAQTLLLCPMARMTGSESPKA